MAAKQSLEDLQQEVTCPLCLGTFEDPRVLPCQHVYCKTCLDALASRGGNVSLICPECRKETNLLEGGVSGLLVAFHMNRLKELVAKMMLEEGTIAEVDAVGTVEADISPRRSGVSSCTRHPSQTLDVYCHKCKEVVCRDCILFDKEHASHPYDKLEVVTKEQREAVEKLLASLLRKQPAIQKIMADVRNAHHYIVESRGVVSAKIGESFDRVMSVIEEKKQSEVQRFQSEAHREVQDLESHEMTLKNFMSEVSAVQSLVERGKLLGDVDFMARKKGMSFKINQMLSRIDNLLLVQHKSDLNAQVIHVGTGSVEEAGLLCDRYLQPYKVVDPLLLQCTASATTGDERIQIGEAATASIVLNGSDGIACCIQQCITVELCSARFGERVSAKVVVQSASHYEALYTPSLRTRGNCQLFVKVNGCLIGGKPMPVFVECPPKLLGEPVSIINDIQHPGFLKVVNDRMLCRTSSGSGICVIDINNTNKPPLVFDMFPRGGKIKMWNPDEMTVDSKLNFWFVSDTENGMVHKFTIDGRYVKSTDRTKVMLNRPNGLSVAGDGNVYVCDSNNHCIRIFNHDLLLLRTFGSLGTAPGMFNWPDNIDFDSSGQFYVTEFINHRIQCFTSDGQPKWCAGSHGDQPGELNCPNIMQIVGCNIFITDCNGVSVFTTSGQFVIRFACKCAESCGGCLDGLAVDKDEFVFVADVHDNRIVMF